MKNIICFGEILWDMLPTGKKLGGAPLNVALRIQSFGHHVKTISSIGNDKAGEEILLAMKEYTADRSLLQISNQYSTSEVLVTLDKSGSASYEIKMPCAWDDIKLMNKDMAEVKSSDAFIFGSLAARKETSRETLFALIDCANFNVFDVNLRPPHYSLPVLLQMMEKAHFIKFNDDEIVKISSDFGCNETSLEARIQFIAKKTNTSNICVTMGEKGAVLFTHNQFVYNEGYKIQVADTVGAGDSFLATLITRLLEGVDPQQAIDFASAVGAIVASKSGANPPGSSQEIENYNKVPHSFK